MNIKQIEKEADEEIFGAKALPCCKVCACDNGKKIWCACHRKQIKSFYREKFKEMLEGLKVEVCCEDVSHTLAWEIELNSQIDEILKDLE